MEGVRHGKNVCTVHRFEHVEVFVELRFDAMGDACIGDDDGGSTRQAFEFACCGDDLVAVSDVGRKRMVTFAPAR